MKFYPLFIKTMQLRIVVFGGQEMAESKIALLLKSDAKIDVIAQTLSPRIQDWVAQGQLTHLAEMPNLDSYDLGYITIHDPLARKSITLQARQARLWLNIVDDLDASDFLTPAIVDRDPVIVAIGTEGTSPTLARKIKSLLEMRLPQNLGNLARSLSSTRSQIQNFPMHLKKVFWERIFEGDLDKFPYNLNARIESFQQNRPVLEGTLDFIETAPEADLLSLRARNRLEMADIISYHHTIPHAVSEILRREAKMIDHRHTGAPSLAQLRQDHIEAKIVHVFPKNILPQEIFDFNDASILYLANQSQSLGQNNASAPLLKQTRRTHG